MTKLKSILYGFFAAALAWLIIEPGGCAYRWLTLKPGQVWTFKGPNPYEDTITYTNVVLSVESGYVLFSNVNFAKTISFPTWQVAMVHKRIQ